MRKIIVIGHTRRGEFQPESNVPEFSTVEEAEEWLLASKRYNGYLGDVYLEIKTLYTNARE